MSGTTSYLVDCSSYQGSPAWAKVAATCAGAAEKVTEGVSYVNPDWAVAKTGLLQVAAHGFVPLAYLFMDATPSGAAQAEYFASKAGSLAGFGIVVDFERASDGSPTLASAQACAAELRKLYPGHPVGGYAPKWFTGSESLAFCDWLWASDYVSGSGDPGQLYKGVPASWWAPYGGKTPLLLQFTSAASVAGVTGPVDCSAFMGTAAQLAAKVLPAPPKPVPVPVSKPTPEDTVGNTGQLIPLASGALHVNVPVAAALPSADFSIVVTGDTGSVVTATAWFSDGGAAQVNTYTLHNGQSTSVVFRQPWAHVTTVRLQRQDTKTSLAASGFVRF